MKEEKSLDDLYKDLEKEKKALQDHQIWFNEHYIDYAGMNKIFDKLNSDIDELLATNTKKNSD